MKQRVELELASIEREFDVHVLFAVESGSRAWGFASPDSDYDVRFVYAHRRDWYLGVFEQRDVIEKMLDGELDVSGWELRKALRLFSRCNLALNEWIGSPIVYSETSGLRTELLRLLPAYFNPIAGVHHYRRMAEHALTENLRDDRIRIKKLFYVLRPLLACRWIIRTQSQPPTQFHRLVTQPWICDDERSWIDALLDQKNNAVESQPVELTRERAIALQREIESYRVVDTLVSAPARERRPSELDELLRRWIEP